MSPREFRTAALKNIASDMIDRAFPWGVSNSQRAELVTSLVRQWRTTHGHAALFTDEFRYWMKLTIRFGDEINVAVTHGEGSPLKGFISDWKIDPDQAPEIISRLNLGQSAEFNNLDGKRLRFSVDPKKRSLSIELVTDAEGE